MPRNTKKARKRMRLSPDKRAQAKRIRRTTTEGETVEQALDLLSFRNEVIEGVRLLAGSRLLRRRRRAR